MHFSKHVFFHMKTCDQPEKTETHPNVNWLSYESCSKKYKIQERSKKTCTFPNTFFP